MHVRKACLNEISAGFLLVRQKIMQSYSEAIGVRISVIMIFYMTSVRKCFQEPQNAGLGHKKSPSGRNGLSVITKGIYSEGFFLIGSGSSFCSSASSFLSSVIFFSTASPTGSPIAFIDSTVLSTLRNSAFLPLSSRFI